MGPGPGVAQAWGAPRPWGGVTWCLAQGEPTVVQGGCVAGGGRATVVSGVCLEKAGLATDPRRVPPALLP